MKISLRLLAELATVAVLTVSVAILYDGRVLPAGGPFAVSSSSSSGGAADAPPATGMSANGGAASTAFVAAPTTADKTTGKTFADKAPPALQTLEANIDAIAEKYNASGLSLVAFEGERVVFSRYSGYADRKRTKKVTADTKYRIASVSKTVTGILAFQLAGEGKLDLDRDISDYMGVRVRNPAYPNKVITTRMLLGHTSSIVGGAAYTKNTGNPPFDPFEKVMNSKGFFSSREPGNTYSYSNVGAAMVGGVIEGVTGRRFYDYATEQLNKLGIDAGYLRTKVKTPDTIAQIYYKNSLRADIPNWGRVESAYDILPLGQMYLLGHGDLIISAADLVKLAMVMAGDGTYGGQTVLVPAALEAMRKPALKINRIGDRVGLALSMTDALVKGRTIFGHSGQANHMIAGFYFDPLDQTGVVFLTNGCATTKNTDRDKYKITVELMNAVYGACFKQR